MAYKHTGFWYSMDTKRDHERLEKLWNEVLLGLIEVQCEDLSN